MTEEIKAGRRHSDNDQKMINAIVENAIGLGADHPSLIKEKAAVTILKGADITADTHNDFAVASIKALGDMQLEIKVAWGGPYGGKDAHKEYFSDRTDFDIDNFPTPPVSYYHGYTDSGQPEGKPIFIGKTIKRENRQDGHYLTVKLNGTGRNAQYAAKAYDAALKGNAPASPGTASHLRRVARDGLCEYWPIVEIATWDGANGKAPANPYSQAMPVIKALYDEAEMSLPAKAQDLTEAANPALGATDAATNSPTKSTGDLKMEQKEVAELVAAELRKAREAEAAEKKAQDERAAEIEAAIKKDREERDAEAAKANRLPTGRAPYATKFGELKKFDNLDAGDTALVIEVANAAKKAQRGEGASDAAYKSLAIKLDESKEEVYQAAKSEMKAAGIKANELNYSTQAGYGDEWVGVAYSTRLWEAIRQRTFIADRLMSRAIEIPAGHESIVLPLEGADMTWYKVAQSTANDSTMGTPVASVTASKTATGNKTLSLVKMGARNVWSGEMEEDSLIPFVAQLRAQLEKGAAEQLEHAVIDGDTEAGATTNINDIGGTPAGTEAFMLVNGFRKSCLVTTTANSRSAGGSFVAADFLETVKLMGLAGRNAIDKGQVEFITDLWTAWKALDLPEVKTRDVFASPTIENGTLSSIYGYKVNASAFMHYANQDATYGLKANVAGKVDLDTAANNLYGALLAVRFDQWQFGIRRRMTIELQRIPQADATQIVAMMRFGLTQRDTEASAISYYVGV